MAEKKKPGKKAYDGKASGASFRAINDCQIFCSRLYEFTAKAEREYRITVCKQIQEYACQMVHSARLANTVRLKDPYRQEVHKQTQEWIERINDLLPVIRRLRCISNGQEAELQKSLKRLKYSLKYWVESDIRRIKSGEAEQYEQRMADPLEEKAEIQTEEGQLPGQMNLTEFLAQKEP